MQPISVKNAALSRQVIDLPPDGWIYHRMDGFVNVIRRLTEKSIFTMPCAEQHTLDPWIYVLSHSFLDSRLLSFDGKFFDVKSERKDEGTVGKVRADRSGHCHSGGVPIQANRSRAAI
ncbi:hypothetical protein PZA22_09165 [Pectobacterium polaris]|uniref:hypothetical protein n=1 Tax=Pectobacterium polaris TaxID=2042057 RepID=UPI0011B2050B|nr:hypothetical protein [Pectobacterium polaris]MDE8754661.1 hypothetical protein [Pectobacterium polaris]